MSKPTAYAPSPELFPGLRTDSRIQWQVLPDDPVLRCPHCQAVTPFEAYYPRKPVPELPDRAAFDKASRALIARGFHFRDLVCQGCGRSARVVYGAIEFAMSSYLFVPEQVLMGAPR